MTRHQCGISALVSHKSFHGKTNGGVAKHRLVSQARSIESVRIGSETSEPRLVSYGVPPGSILGPALFNIKGR